MTGEYQSAEAYGKHSQTNAHGLSVAELLKRVVRRGEALRLAWRGHDPDVFVDQEDEFPTAVLPVVRDEPAAVLETAVEAVPRTLTRDARKWSQPPGFSWWLRLLFE